MRSALLCLSAALNFGFRRKPVAEAAPAFCMRVLAALRAAQYCRMRSDRRRLSTALNFGFRLRVNPESVIRTEAPPRPRFSSRWIA